MSLREISGRPLLFSAVFFGFAPLLSAEAQDVDVQGNLTMHDSTDATTGNVLKGDVPFLHNFGTANTFLGGGAGNFNMGGGYNTAIAFQALQSNTTGAANTAHGAAALFSNTEGDENTACGNAALYSNTTGNNNTAIGFYADVSAGNLNNATAIGSGAVVNASNKIRFGNQQVTVIEGQVPYTYTSDRNQKENFRTLDADEVLAKLRGLSVTSWNYKGQDAKQFRHYGPVAQDFFGAFGHDAVGTIGTPTTITSGDLDGILIVAAQALEKRPVEHKKEINALRKETEVLKARNANLEARLEALERRVGREVATKARARF